MIIVAAIHKEDVRQVPKALRHRVVTWGSRTPLLVLHSDELEYLDPVEIPLHERAVLRTYRDPVAAARAIASIWGAETAEINKKVNHEIAKLVNA